MPIRQESRRPVLVVRDRVPTVRELLLTLCSCLCYRGREGGMGREKIAFYCLSIYWQIAQPPFTLPPPSSLTMLHLLWAACSVPRPTNHFHVLGKVTARCTACPLEPIVNSSIRPPPPPLQAERQAQTHSSKLATETHAITPTFSPPSLCLFLPHTNTGRELNCAVSGHNFFLISARSRGSQRIIYYTGLIRSLVS